MLLHPFGCASPKEIDRTSGIFTLPCTVDPPCIYRAPTMQVPCLCRAPTTQAGGDNCALEQLVVEHLERHAAAASSPEVLIVEGRLFSFQHG